MSISLFGLQAGLDSTSTAGAATLSHWWWVPLSLPFILITFDIVYKRLIFRSLPYDSMADMALAAIAFTGVHLLGRFISNADGGKPELSGLPVVASFVLIILQILVWLVFLFLGKPLKGAPEGRLLLSYAAGAFWFTLTAGLVLLIFPG